MPRAKNRHLRYRLVVPFVIEGVLRDAPQLGRGEDAGRRDKVVRKGPAAVMAVAAAAVVVVTVAIVAVVSLGIFAAAARRRRRVVRLFTLVFLVAETFDKVGQIEIQLLD